MYGEEAGVVRESVTWQVLYTVLHNLISGSGLAPMWLKVFSASSRADL